MCSVQNYLCKKQERHEVNKARKGIVEGNLFLITERKEERRKKYDREGRFFSCSLLRLEINDRKGSQNHGKGVWTERGEGIRNLLCCLLFRAEIKERQEKITNPWLRERDQGLRKGWLRSRRLLCCMLFSVEIKDKKKLHKIIAQRKG